MQRSRRQDPYPLTWEIPVAVIAGIGVALVYGAHLGRAVANLFAGAGWTWPPPTAVFRSIPSLLAGDAASGLGAGHALLAGRSAVLVCIVATELALLAIVTVAAQHAWLRWGPSRIKGVATRAEAESLLGRSRLRKVAHVVRPDLGVSRRRTFRPGAPS